jgi:hypothetical protein
MRCGSTQRPSITIALVTAAERAGNILPVIDVLRSADVNDLRGLAKALNQRGVRTARGGRWHVSTVRNVIARSSSCGGSFAARAVWCLRVGGGILRRSKLIGRRLPMASKPALVGLFLAAVALILATSVPTSARLASNRLASNRLASNAVTDKVIVDLGAMTVTKVTLADGTVIALH